MSRPPKPPARSEIGLDEAEDYDNIIGRFAGRRTPDGGIDPGPYFSVLLNSPLLAGPLVEAGVRLEAIEALMDGREEDLTEDEVLLATYIRQVVMGR